MNRMIVGGIAGITATAAMTIAMRVGYRQLEDASKRPLPPSELIYEIRGRQAKKAHGTETLLGHFIFGALAGTIYACCCRQTNGALYGMTVWAASYLGWVPAAGLLPPATRHPADRTLLMLLAHVIWGLAASGTIRQLEKSQRDIFAPPSAGNEPEQMRGG